MPICNSIRFIFSVFILVLFTSLTVYSQQPALSIQFSRLNEPESLPVIQLKSMDQLLLQFDLADSYNNALSYKITHCDASWVSSGLPFDIYQSGFEMNPLPQGNPSINTLNSFVHYTLILPNDDVSLLYSGNYIIEVVDTYQPDSVFLQARFYVKENLTSCEGNYTASRDADVSKYWHEMQFTCNVPLTVDNPYEDLQFWVTQNRNPHQYKEVKPDYILGNSFSFQSDPGLSWEAGNEFRTFNINDTRFVSEGVQKITFEEGSYHFWFNPLENRRFKRYQYYKDMNGQFRIDKSLSTDVELEADYVHCHFELPLDAPFIQEKVYLMGEFNQFRLDENYQLKWDLAHKAYLGDFLLKQGYYNYLIAVANESEEIDIERFEGNFSLTQNEYLLFVYYQAPGTYYQRLLNILEITRP